MNLRFVAALTLTPAFVAPFAAASVANELTGPTRVAGDQWLADFDKAAALAKEQGKDLLVDFTGSDWCGWCIKLHEEVFAHAEWSDAVAKDYVLVALDFPNGEEAKAKVPSPERNEALKNEYGIQGFPTILLMTPAGDVFGQTGYQPGGPKAYLEHMAELREKGKPELQRVIDLVSGVEKAEGAERLAGLTKVVAFLADAEPDVAGKRHLVRIARIALVEPGDEAAQLRKDAMAALIGVGEIDAEILAAALEMDPKNENGLHEKALDAFINSVASEEDVKFILPKLEAFAELEKRHDTDTAGQILALAAVWNERVMQDMEKAKRLAKLAIENGHSNQQIMDVMQEILDK